MIGDICQRRWHVHDLSGRWPRRWTGGPRRRRRPGRDLAVPALRVVRGADDGDHDRLADAVDGGREQRGRVGLGAVAEHDVEQDARRWRGSAAARARCSSRRRRVDHRVGAARRCRRRRRSRRTCGRASAPSSSVAISRASPSSVPPTNNPRSIDRRYPRSAEPGDRPGRHVVAQPPQHATRRRRSGRAGRRRAARTRPGSPGRRRTPRISAATSARRRLGDHHDQLDRGVLVEPAQRLAGGQPARPRRTGRGRRRRARTPTPTPAWSSSASSCWQPVPDAATMPTGPGEMALAKPRPSAADDGGAAVGSHHQQAALGGGRA